MTSDLRKAHKIIWIVLVLIIPVLMYFSILWDPYTEIESSKTSSTATINSFTHANEYLSYQVEDSRLFVFVKEPLKNASAAVYEVIDGKKGRLLGEISAAKKLYIFNLSQTTDGFEVYDVIKNERIFKIKL